MRIEGNDYMRTLDFGYMNIVTFWSIAMLLGGLLTVPASGQNQPENWKEDGNAPNDIKVLSLLPEGNAGTEVDDGDNNSNTKMFIFPVTSGASVSVVATPDRTITEAELPREWSLTGVPGDGKLSRTISLHEPGKFVLKCQCGDSVKETTIYVIKMDFDNPKGDPENYGSDQNEFVFSNAPTGVLTINLSVQVTPEEAAEKIKDLLGFFRDLISYIWAGLFPVK
ncbi:MAG: hypothetical protein IJS15_05690, partial [Victivallales bacterium]|nr:hypothetical protein [Victivallales bacterium]